MLARPGMIGMMAFANKIECESHQLEQPRSRAHALALTRTTGILHRWDQTYCARTLPGRRRRRLKRWKQARNVPPITQSTGNLTDSCTRIAIRLTQRHQQEQQQEEEYHTGACARTLPGRRRRLRRWKQARNVHPIRQITNNLADHYTRIATCLTLRHRPEQ